MFRNVAKEHPTNKCIGSRNLAEGANKEYVWKNYQEVAGILEDLARGMEHLKLLSDVVEEGRKRRVIVNLGWQLKEETMLLSIAVWHIGGCMMSDTEELREIPELKVGVVSREDIQMVCDKKANNYIPGITTLVVVNEFTQIDVEKAAGLKLTLLSYKDILKAGQMHKEIPLPGCKPDDLIGICPTSGTTGSDKVK